MAAVSVAVGLQHLLIALRLEQRGERLLFALTGGAVAVDALVQRRMFESATPAEFEAFLGWSAVSIAAPVALIAWFIAARTGVVRRWLLIADPLPLAATAALDFVVPDDRSHFLRVEAVREVVLPWGETVSMAVGTAPVRRVDLNREIPVKRAANTIGPDPGIVPERS